MIPSLKIFAHKDWHVPMHHTDIDIKDSLSKGQLQK